MGKRTLKLLKKEICFYLNCIVLKILSSGVDFSKVFNFTIFISLGSFWYCQWSEEPFELNNRIYKYRKTNRLTDPDPQIGCIILSMPFYLNEDDWIPAPNNWNTNIVQGKIYDTSDFFGKRLYQQIQAALQKQKIHEDILREDSVNSRYGKEQIIKPRIGQGAFKVLITDAYHRRCAITGEKTLPALEAAHIKPYYLDGPHEINNGLLLRRDFHTLFDRGYLTIDKEFNVEVSHRIKEDFGNGREYYAHHGSKLIISLERKEQLPDPQYLEWHNENVYLDN